MKRSDIRYNQFFHLMKEFLLFEQNIKKECIEDELTSTILIDKTKLDVMLNNFRQTIKRTVEVNVSMYQEHAARTALEFMTEEKNNSGE